jgi:hypothetical protein
MEKLSANQRWKKSGTTLPFKEWINRENEKEKAKESSSLIPFDEPINNFEKNFQNFDTNQMVNDTISSTLNPDVYTYKPPLVTEENKNQVLGLDRNIFIFSSLIIVGSLSFYFYKKLKDKK